MKKLAKLNNLKFKELLKSEISEINGGKIYRDSYLEFYYEESPGGNIFVGGSDRYYA
ncbi:MAG: hypothetical protein E6772_03125 [Dysgonomonas sp.]|nr:hypothetical protein [Dysgonomonas sp.]